MDCLGPPSLGSHGLYDHNNNSEPALHLYQILPTTYYILSTIYHILYIYIHICIWEPSLYVVCWALMQGLFLEMLLLLAVNVAASFVKFSPWLAEACSSVLILGTRPSCIDMYMYIYIYPFLSIDTDIDMQRRYRYTFIYL